MLGEAHRHVRILGAASLTAVSMMLAAPASAGCDANLGNVSFPQFEVVGDGVEYTDVEGTGYAWNAKFDVVCGVFGKVTDWELAPYINVEGLGNLGFRPYFGASTEYPPFDRPKEVHWQESIPFPRSYVQGFAVAACNLHADALRENGWSNAAIFSREHRIAFQHFFLVNVGYINTLEVGHVGFFGPGFGEVVCKQWSASAFGVVIEEMELLGATLVLFPNRYEGACPKDMRLFAQVEANLKGPVTVRIESTAGWKSDRGVLETSEFDEASNRWNGEIDELLAVPVQLPVPPRPDGVVPPSPATGFVQNPDDPDGGLPPGPEWSPPDLTGEDPGSNVHAESLRLIASVGDQTIMSEWQGYSYTCDPKRAIDVPTDDLVSADDSARPPRRAPEAAHGAGPAEGAPPPDYSAE